MPPRVLCLSDLWAPFPGGAERLAFNLARHVMREGADVQVVTGYEYPQQFDGPPIWQVLNLEVAKTRAVGAAVLTELIRWWGPDVIIAHALYAYQFEDVLRASGIPLVQIVLNTRRIEWASHAVYISGWVRDRLGDAHPNDQTILPPVFADVIAATRGHSIGFIKPIEHKGVDLFYQLAARMPDRQFVVLRGEWQDLERICDRPNITFMEPVDDIRDFYAECRIVLMPSLSEDAGTVAQEAAANGIPCISSDVGGLRETNAGGWVLPPSVPSLWAGAIRALDNPDTYGHLVGRQREHFDGVEQAARLDRFARRVHTIAGR